MRLIGCFPRQVLLFVIVSFFAALLVFLNTRKIGKVFGW